MNIAFVWNRDVPSELSDGAHIGTHLLHLLTGHDLLTWQNEPPDTLRHYDLFFVNLFAGMTHVEQIKAIHPEAQVVAVPDAYMDEVFLNRDWLTESMFLRQLQAADALAVTSYSNRQFYGALLDKPVFIMPLAIGSRDYFERVRREPKKDYVLVIDHNPLTIPRATLVTIQNMAALALFRRYCEAKIIYINPAPHTTYYARTLGLENIHFKPYMVYADFVRAAAQARVGLDLYPLYGFGRNEITLAYAGTPVVGSTHTETLALDMGVEPFHCEQAAQRLVTLYEDAGLRQTWVERNHAWVEQRYSFEAAAAQMQALIGELTCDRIPAP